MIDSAIPVESTSRRWVRVLLVVVCALIAAMWVYGFVFAPKQGIYLVTEKSWRTTAERICTIAGEQRQALADTTEGYISNPTPAQMIQHADIVDRATDTVEGMINDVEALPLAGSDDRQRVAIFVEYYRQIIDDRRAYTARLRAFELEPYRESLVNGSPVTNTVIAFTTGNAIPHCAPPGELGGDT